MKKGKNELISQEDMMRILDACYQKCLNGIPKVSVNVEEMANDYLSKHITKEDACKAMLKNQVVKCTTSGFITGFGGIITLPVTLPANVTSVIYIQMRMIACTAYMAGYNINSDQTQTLVYACLAGVAVNEIVKQTGIKVGVKVTTELIKKIPGKTLTSINQKVGFRLVTKFGSKGAVNLGKMVPGVGAVIGGGFDLVETKIIAQRAYKWFFDDNFTVEENKDRTNRIDIKKKFSFKK